ncbi:MAG TPA: flagellar biosynthesis protein [Clostridiaceae bacterium]|nr:flagellar biosynthesis protein [Clostridiaceae bacterium]
MSRGIYKNYQVNIGIPFQICTPISPHVAKAADEEDAKVEEPENNPEVDPQDLLAEAREKAGLIINEAKLEASKILKEAEEKANILANEIIENARKAGYEKGYMEGKKQYESLIKEAEFIRERAKTEYKEILAGIEPDIINLSLEIANKVLAYEINVDKESILPLVKQAVEKCTNRESVTLKVSPDDYDTVCQNIEKLRTMIEDLGNLQVMKDFSLKSGNFFVETLYGCIDAGIETKLRKIEEAFKLVIGK